MSTVLLFLCYFCMALSTLLLLTFLILFSQNGAIVVVCVYIPKSICFSLQILSTHRRFSDIEATGTIRTFFYRCNQTRGSVAFYVSKVIIHRNSIHIQNCFETRENQPKTFVSRQSFFVWENGMAVATLACTWMNIRIYRIEFINAHSCWPIWFAFVPHRIFSAISKEWITTVQCQTNGPPPFPLSPSHPKITYSIRIRCESVIRIAYCSSIITIIIVILYGAIRIMNKILWYYYCYHLLMHTHTHIYLYIYS